MRDQTVFWESPQVQVGGPQEMYRVARCESCGLSSTVAVRLRLVYLRHRGVGGRPSRSAATR